MASSQFSLSWDAHEKNICNGLSSLQQNGEFVDMTLAADGHMVKVHQVIIALASPYIKELISSAQCQHPVIFLNKISYTTLSSILEYIYTGEAVVSIENLDNLVDAAKELHIRGLEDMKIQGSTPPPAEETSQIEEEMLDEEYCYFEVTAENGDREECTRIYTTEDYQIKPQDSEQIVQETFEENSNERTIIPAEEQEPTILPDSCDIGDKPNITARLLKRPRLSARPNLDVNSSNVGVMQYTVSNQGSLQMILNRYIYYLKHTNRDGSRQWRCVDYLNSNKCPAHVNTKDDIVQQRIASHNHLFHDKRILKKLKANAIFSAIQDAEEEGALHKNAKLSDSIQESE